VTDELEKLANEAKILENEIKEFIFFSNIVFIVYIELIFCILFFYFIGG